MIRRPKADSPNSSIQKSTARHRRDSQQSIQSQGSVKSKNMVIHTLKTKRIPEPQTIISDQTSLVGSNSNQNYGEVQIGADEPEKFKIIENVSEEDIKSPNIARSSISSLSINKSSLSVKSDELGPKTEQNSITQSILREQSEEYEDTPTDEEEEEEDEEISVLDRG